MKTGDAHQGTPSPSRWRWDRGPIDAVLGLVFMIVAFLLLAAIVRRSFGDRAVGSALLFTLASPVFAAYGISFYAMMAHLAFNLLYAWLLLSPTLLRVAGAGLVGGFALALSGLSTFLGYALIGMSGGHGWGYRYFFSAWSCLPLLAASMATDRSPRELAEAAADPGRGDATADILRAIGLAAVLSLAISLPVRLWQIHAFIAEHRAQLPPKPVTEEIGSSDVVLFINKEHGYFRHDLIRNDPFLARGPFMFVSTGLEDDTRSIKEIAKAAGRQARMMYSGDRGSSWILQPAPEQESAL